MMSSDDASLVTRYGDIAQKRQNSLRALQRYRDSLAEREQILIQPEGEFLVSEGKYTHARRLLTIDSGEFLVNTYTNSDQVNPSVGAFSDGGFVIAWESNGQDDGDGPGVYAQRFNASGTPLGSEFRVNTYTIYYQWYPSVGAFNDGGFVIAWESGGQDGDGVYAGSHQGQVLNP